VQSFFQDFTLDNGRTAVVCWGYSREEVLIEEIWDKETEHDIPELNGDESARFDELVLALDPFPPYEDYGD